MLDLFKAVICFLTGRRLGAQRWKRRRAPYVLVLEFGYLERATETDSTLIRWLGFKPRCLDSDPGLAWAVWVSTDFLITIETWDGFRWVPSRKCLGYPHLCDMYVEARPELLS